MSEDRAQVVSSLKLATWTVLGPVFAHSTLAACLGPGPPPQTSTATTSGTERPLGCAGGPQTSGGARGVIREALGAPTPPPGPPLQKMVFFCQHRMEGERASDPDSKGFPRKLVSCAEQTLQLAQAARNKLCSSLNSK